MLKICITTENCVKLKENSKNKMAVLLGSIKSKKSLNAFENKVNSAISFFVDSWYFLSRSSDIANKNKSMRLLNTQLNNSIKVYNKVYNLYLRKYNFLSDKHEDAKKIGNSIGDKLTETVLRLQDAIFELRAATALTQNSDTKNDLKKASSTLVKEYNKLYKITENLI